jgi:hypothetical protein
MSTETLLDEILDRDNKSVETAHGHVTCVPNAGVWLVTFRPMDAEQPPVTWRAPDVKAAGRLVSALIAPDVGLMVACMRDLWRGSDVVDDDFLARLSELKRRDIVRQTRHGSRVLPTRNGAGVWRAAMEAVAREVLGGAKRRGHGRPYFVVFDAKSRATGFRDWDRAAAFAQHVVSQSPVSFAAVGSHEDLVEIWQGCMFSPATLSEMDRNGIGKIEA